MMSAEENDKGVQIEHLKAQPVLIIRETVQIERLGESVGERIGALSDFLRQHGVKPAGPPFVRYHTFGEIETDFEFGVPVAEPYVGEGRVLGSELPGGAAAATWHTGPHNKLGEAYARIDAFIREQGREAEGPAREVYHWIDLGQEQHSSVQDTSNWRTELVQPLK
jgi:effector-binding domain-containing protein